MSRLKSRKLWAWSIWTVLILISVIVTKTINPEIVSWYGAVTVIYIGGQSAVDAVEYIKRK